MRIAKIYDSAGPGGPEFDEGHALVRDAGEKEKLLRFLASGEAIVRAPGSGLDCVDGQLGNVVPLGFRTDGVWIWSEAIAYYLRAHDLGPEAEFHHYIESLEYVAPIPTDADVELAVAHFHQARAENLSKSAQQGA